MCSIRGTAVFAPTICGAVCIAACLVGCAKQPEDHFPEFDAPELQLGRALWLENCQACHASGLAGAPRIGDRVAWEPRIHQGLPTLFEHALKGFAGPSGTEMPARGGNAKLSDAAVKAAVRCMVGASE